MGGQGRVLPALQFKALRANYDLLSREASPREPVTSDVVGDFQLIADYIRRRVEDGRMDVPFLFDPEKDAEMPTLTAQGAMREAAVLVRMLNAALRLAFGVSPEVDREEAITILLYLNDFISHGLADGQCLIDHEADDELVRQRISRAFCAADAALHDRLKSYVWRSAAREEVAEYERAMEQEDGDDAGLPNPIQNAELARRAGIDGADRMSRQIRIALKKHYRENGSAVPLMIGSEQGCALYWRHDDLRRAYPHLRNDTKLKNYLSRVGFAKPTPAFLGK